MSSTNQNVKLYEKDNPKNRFLAVFFYNQHKHFIVKNKPIIKSFSKNLHYLKHFNIFDFKQLRITRNKSNSYGHCFYPIHHSWPRYYL